MAKLPMMNAKPMGPKPMGLGRGKPGAAAMLGRTAREGMPSTGPKPMGLGRGKPGAAMPGRTAREGMPSMGTSPMGMVGRGKPGAAMPGRTAREGMSSPAVMPSRAPLKPAQSRGAPGDPGYSSTPNYTPSAAGIARNKQEGAARINAMSPMARLSQNAPKFKG
jgi:hypothetical protein